MKYNMGLFGEVTNDALKIQFILTLSLVYDYLRFLGRSTSAAFQIAPTPDPAEL